MDGDISWIIWKGGSHHVPTRKFRPCSRKNRVLLVRVLAKQEGDLFERDCAHASLTRKANASNGLGPAWT
jgi:hypothetical protein